MEDLEDKVANIREAIETNSKEIQDRQDARNEDSESKYLELRNEMHRMQEIARNENYKMHEKAMNEMHQMTERILREV